MAYENTGILSFANALGNAGQSFGNALATGFAGEKRQKYLSELGGFAQNGDYIGLAKTAFANGDVEMGMRALKQAEDMKLRQADAEVLAPFRGGAAPSGPTGGVTVNPNPQPMNLPGGLPGNQEVSQYIIDAAKKRGIDPGQALRVYQSEGAGGYTGDSNSSFGPFQLHYGGVAPGGNRVAGLGDEFTKQTGLDARNPQTWRQQVDFALDRAKQGGWGPWHGWKGDQWAGIRGVQVADASGAIPQSAQPQQLPTPDGPSLQSLEARISNIDNALSRAKLPETRQKLEDLRRSAEEEYKRIKERTTPKLQQFGDTVYDTAGGQLKPVQKIEKTPQEKALTEGQSNAAMFADRMQNAEKVLEDSKLLSSSQGWTGASNQLLGKLPMGIGATQQGSDFKRFDRAKRDFIGAALRKESGAAISQTEYDNADKMWFPQPWDDEQTIKDKATARRLEIEGLRRASGPAAQTNPNSAASILDEARSAILRGADRAKVIERLRAKGIDASGL